MVTKAEIDSATWKRSTYGGSPHEYIVWHWYPDLVEKLSKEVAEHGVMETWKGRKYPYWYFEGYKYWRIGAVINRVKV